MARTIVVPALVLLLTASCGKDTCAIIEDNLDECNVAYLGDDNCELLLEPCNDDDHTVIEALFECYGGACSGTNNNLQQCDETHFPRLSSACQDSWTP